MLAVICMMTIQSAARAVNPWPACGRVTRERRGAREVGIDRQTPEQSGHARIVNGRLHEQVVGDLTRQIASGALEPGAGLPTEVDLAQRFGVSRTVVREAVRVLVAKGLIVVRQGSGMSVAPPERWSALDPLVLFERVRARPNDRLLDDLLEVRRIVEVEAAALAAARGSSTELARLADIVDRMATLLDDADAYTEVDIAFHAAVLDTAGNTLLREMFKPVASMVGIGRLITARQQGRLVESHEGHEAICRAIAAHDAATAQAMMRRHIAQFEEDIRQSLTAWRPGSVSIESRALAVLDTTL